MSLRVVPVDTPALLDTFLGVAAGIYADDVDAVLPLRAVLRRRLASRSLSARAALALRRIRVEMATSLSERMAKASG